MDHAKSPDEKSVAKGLGHIEFRRLEPVIRRVLILVILFGQVTFYFSSTNVHLDPDIWWHLATGRWIVQHSSIPFTDPFSQFGQTRPWVAYTWLFDLLTFELYQLQGAMGIEVLKVVLGVLFTLALYLFLQELTGSLGVSALLAVLALVACLSLMTPRPWLFTMLFFTLELALLTRMRSDRSTAAFWLLPPLFVLWSNLHIQFIYGLILIGFFLAAGVQERFMRSAEGYTGSWPAARRYAVALALCTAATLVNPYGFRLYSTVWEYANQAAIYPLIQELSPPDFRSVAHWFFVGLILVAVFVLARRRTISVLPYLLLAFGLCCALRMQRDAWLAAVAGAAVIAGWPVQRSADRISDPEWTPGVLTVTAIAALSLLLVPTFFGVTDDDLKKETSNNYPVRAVEFMSAQALSGPVYNYFGWGGYLTWTLPSMPVSIDGRTNVHGKDRILRNYLTWNGRGDWAGDPDLKRARLVLGPRTEPLISILRLDSSFLLRYEDKNAVVFMRRAEPN